MRRRSNQRITKIKKDFIEELLKRAEAMDVADGTSIQPPGSDLIPYPDMNNLRHWTRDYLLKGLTKVYPVKLDTDGQTYLTTLIDGLPLFTKMSKTIGVQDQSVLVPDRISSFITVVGNPNIDRAFNVSGFSASNYLTIPSSELYANPLNIWTICYEPGELINDNSTAVLCLTPTINEIWMHRNSNELFYWDRVNSSNTDFYTPSSSRYWVKFWSTLNTDNTYQLHISTSEDGENYTERVNTNNGPLNTSSYPTYLGVDMRPDVPYHSPVTGTMVLSECKIEHPDGTISEFLHYTEQPAIVSKETSKPGLWLSNLIQPVTDSVANS